MTTDKIDGVSITTKASVYFDGKCVSHTLTYPDGTRKSVGVVLPATLTFGTGAPEIWVRSSAGERFSIGANSSFDIRVTEPYHYICHYG
jgi:uncharacterized protein YaiE (UPF0345 family)